MTPKRVDVNIMCTRCQKPIVGEHRAMDHDPASGHWIYTVSCHGATDKGDHLKAKAHEDSHGTTLWAFPNETPLTPRGPSIGPSPITPTVSQPMPRS